jgi:GNAT superfamily N-acetyltransferase
MGRVSDSLCVRIEQYYATVPLLFADAEVFGSLRLFVRKEPGAPYYGGPSHAQPSAEIAGNVTAADIARVRARQRELGVPEAFEWLAEVAPTLRARLEAVGLPVAERPLMVLDPRHVIPPRPLPDGITIRVLTADDPANGATEIGGVGTLPTARRQGLAAAVTAALAGHARDHGVHTVFLAYAQDSVARIYSRLGFRPADVMLLIANQPARS